MSDAIAPRDIIGNLAVRKMLGRALRADRKPMTRQTLIRWRETRGFPAPLDTPHAGHCGKARIELWDRVAVKRWIAQQDPRRPPGPAKLTAEQVDAIKTRLIAGESGAGLAREYGMSEATISRIRSGERWTD